METVVGLMVGHPLSLPWVEDVDQLDWALPLLDQGREAQGQEVEQVVAVDCGLDPQVGLGLERVGTYCQF